MGKISVSTKNGNKPAPKGYRKFEDAMLIIFIPTCTAMIQGWGFEDELFVTRLNLLVAVGLVGMIKFLGRILANGEMYAPVDDEQNQDQENNINQN